jgi:hypothetical protein
MILAPRRVKKTAQQTERAVRAAEQHLRL